MFKLIFGLLLACIIIAFIAEYWMWILLALVVLIGIYAFCVKKGYVKPPEKALPQPAEDICTLKEETFHAAGVSYYEANIRKLACSNPDWSASITRIIKEGKAGKRIYKANYINKPVKLVPEPKNPHDKNAIAVVIAGELVGYISREDNLHVKDILDNREIKSLSAFIGGGEYKIVGEDGDVVRGEYGFSVNVRIKYI